MYAWISEAFKKMVQMLHFGLTPHPPTITKNIMYFFLKLDHCFIQALFEKKCVFAPF